MMKALVLAGGFPQIALLQELKSRGIITVLADWNEEPVAKKYADVFYRASTLDVAAIRDIAQKEAVDFVITVCTDQALHTVAKVSEELGLPCYIDYKTALNVTNKAYMKEMFAAHHIPTTQHVILREFDPEAIAHLHYPLIVKPVDCNSSKGVAKVRNEDELKPALAAAVEYSRTDTAIVEEFAQGQEISVDVYVENDTAHVLCISESDKIADQDKFVIFRARYDHEMDKLFRDRVQQIAQQIADAFGLRDTPMLIQMITDGARFSVIEFSARTGGGLKFLLIRHVSSFDVIKAVVDLTLGLKPHVEPAQPVSPYILNDFIYCSPGVFDRLDGFEEAKAEGLIYDHYLFKWQGAEFDTIKNSGDRVAAFTVFGGSEDEIRDKHRRVVPNMHVWSEQGTEMMRHDLLPEPVWVKFYR